MSSGLTEGVMATQTEDLAKITLAAVAVDSSADKDDKKDKKAEEAKKDVPPLSAPGWKLVPLEEDRDNMEAMWGLVLPPRHCKEEGVGHYRKKWEIREVKDSRRGCRSELNHADYIEFVLDPRFDTLMRDRDIFPTPELVHEARSAVVLKCETGVNLTGENELIRVTAIDYYSGEILIDALVWPEQPMLHFNPRFSGIQPKNMEEEHNERKTLLGREGAREALWRFVGPQTYLIMHQGHIDMGHLRWYHDRMVDTWELQKLMLGGREPQEFKSLVKRLTGRQLPYNRGYSATLQEVMATRNLLHWHAKNLPKDLWTTWRIFSAEECHWAMTYDVLPGDAQMEVWWEILRAMRIFDD
ncbi:uncharacterized protein N7483_004912 [Penicillium malachiteum]|uniref:uncharacterized protein n=1 Tax=Penicillium malachiteum TaxID=1324776 RepID=UPI0025483D33|nr:uncharacterized protein N7483_004912 [Penicillium malachiteum]KAJ5730404.1 hypothetical protein N7483_004912 [Penicillium malachiteum]